MAHEDRRTAGREAERMGGAGKPPSAGAAGPQDSEEGFSDNAFTGTENEPVVRPMARTGTGAKTGTGATDDPGLLSNFVQRTDNDFSGVEDASLIGEDLPEEDEDEEERDR